LLFLLASLAPLAACGAPSDDDDGSTEGADALSGRVTAGRVVQTIGDGLRLRSKPSRVTTANIIGVLPKGTSVKIVDGVPNDGFYKVQVVDAAVAARLHPSTGWVYGEYLNGEAEEPQDPDESRTGTWDVPTKMKARLVVTKCSALKDDKGNAFAPPLDDALAGKSSYAAIALDTNTFSFGMKATIDQVDAKGALNPSAKPIKLKILKTAAASPDGPVTATICTVSGAAEGLATEDGFVDLSVYAYW
jgi:hypothetical protein